MKYVVLQESTGARFCTVVLFAAPLTHKDLANRFGHSYEARSAGFCEFLSDGRVRAFGESTSLNLKPAPGDGPLIEAMARATRKIAGEPLPA